MPEERDDRIGKAYTHVRDVLACADRPDSEGPIFDWLNFALASHPDAAGEILKWDYDTIWMHADAWQQLSRASHEADAKAIATGMARAATRRGNGRFSAFAQSRMRILRRRRKT